MDRQYAAQIAYPFVYLGSESQDNKAILDMLLYVSPSDTVQTAPVGLPAVGAVGAWLTSRAVDIGGLTGTFTFRIKIPRDPEYQDTTVDAVFTEYAYIDRTFDYDMTSAGIITIRGDDGRSALVVNVDALTAVPAGSTVLYTDSVVEPTCVIPCYRKVRNFGVYNEYRAKDPADRSALPPDALQVTLTEGQTLIVNDGFNCAVTYDPNARILRITGGVGLGTGQPDKNVWDDDDGSTIKGIRSVNGVNNGGIVDIQSGAGVLLIGTPGDLEIQLRDQGDDV